ncbi:MAG: ribosome maturation factor RimM [Thermoleophilia bacterium]|nr:ribosome maturation factor RimM [Thermoleophilia bacterium]
MARPEWIEVGRIKRPHGLRGEVRVASSTDNPERFVAGALVYARPARRGLLGAADERTLLRIASVRGLPEEPIVAFTHVDDRDQAGALRGHVLEVPGSELPQLAEGEYYPFELEGLEVRIPGGRAVGVVEELVESPAHDLLVVQAAAEGDAEPREILVPFVAEAVPEVDVSAGYLVVQARFLEPPAEV